MLTAIEIKSLVLSMGADKCGISGINRFNDSPLGFNPTDVYSKCKSVVVFLKRMPVDTIIAESKVPYSHAAYVIYSALDQIGVKLCNKLHQHGIKGVPVPTDVPYLSWDEKNQRGMGIISLRHAAINAGLGILGRNTLLINGDLGNMVYIGAILIDTAIESDELVHDISCPPKCSICLDACPVSALDGKTVNQKLCRKQSCATHSRGWDIYVCNECRKVCPHRAFVR